MTASDQQRPSIVSGEVSITLAMPDGKGLRLLGARDASLALLVNRSGAQLLPLTQLDASVRPSLDPSLSMRVIATAPVQVAEHANSNVWRMGELGVAAMLVGVAEAALDMSVEYAKICETFGRKIGSWQAVRHPCADMALRVEAARAQTWFAATAMKEDRTDAQVHLDAAKHLANQAALANTDTNIQLHGGIGVTDEHNAHLLLKHTLVLVKLFGARRALLTNLLHAHVED